MLLTSSNISVLANTGTIIFSDYDLYGRTRVGLHEPTHVFRFIAYDICNEKYEQCFDIIGEGNYNHNFKEVTGQGNYVKYKEEKANVLESGWWRALDFLEASDRHVIFRAEPAVKGMGLAGFIVIQVFEGETPDAGRICVYGNLFDKQNPSSEADADCTSNANVKIKSVS